MACISCRKSKKKCVFHIHLDKCERCHQLNQQCSLSISSSLKSLTGQSFMVQSTHTVARDKSQIVDVCKKGAQCIWLHPLAHWRVHTSTLKRFHHQHFNILNWVYDGNHPPVLLPLHGSKCLSPTSHLGIYSRRGSHPHNELLWHTMRAPFTIFVNLLKESKNRKRGWLTSSKNKNYLWLIPVFLPYHLAHLS